MNLGRRDFVIAAAGTATLPLVGWAVPELPIIKKAIPSSGEFIPAVGLGTSRTFDVDPIGNIDAQRSVMQRFVELGGTVVDSSPMYGKAEAVVGKAGETLGITDKLFYATKVWTDGEASGRSQMQASSELMKTPVIDLMQVHNLRDLQTHLRTARALKEAGKLRYVGITHYRVDAYDALEKVMREEELDFVQLNYSIATRESEAKLLPLAQERGIAVMVNRAYEGGKLFGKVKGRSLPGVAADLQINSWGQYFLKFVLGHPAVTVVIPATAKVRHLQDNMAAGRGDLPTEQQRTLMAEAVDV